MKQPHHIQHAICSIVQSVYELSDSVRVVSSIIMPFPGFHAGHRRPGIYEKCVALAMKVAVIAHITLTLVKNMPAMA